MSFFESVTQLPNDPILQLPILFREDPRGHKVNLGIGTYKDAEGDPLILTAVKKAEEILLSEEREKEYLPIEGVAQFLHHIEALILGEGILDCCMGRLFTAQTLGGTGALRVGGEFLIQETSRTIFLPNPTWPNHKPVFAKCGFKIHQYRYYDEATHRLDFPGMCSDISNMPPGSTLLLHACCHNPTGVDPSFEQWCELSQLIKRQKIIPFFDFAYQGIGDGLEKDAEAIRYFAKQGHEMLVAHSYSKNFGLYGERVGALMVLGINKESIWKVASQIKQIIRGNYSNPPMHGSKIVSTILASEILKKEWMRELTEMRERIEKMRQALAVGLQSRSDKDWSFLSRQKGFFSFFGFSQEQVHRLIKEHAVYMPAMGRLNIAGLNAHNIHYVIQALRDVIHAPLSTL